MATDVDALLGRCLDARTSGRPLEECFAGLDPALRREVEPLVRLAELLRHAPRPALPTTTTAYQEHRLLAQAPRLRATGAVRPAWLPAARRLPLASLADWRFTFVPVATVFLLLLSVVLGGGATAMVSNAGPDDALYSWKLSWEQTQLQLAGNDGQRARVFIGMAQGRIGEIEQLARQGQPIPPDLLLQVRLSVDQAIALSANLGGADAIPILRQLSELLAYERVLLGRFLAALPEPERATVELALTAVEQTEQVVSQTLEGRVQESLPAPAVTPAPTPTAAAQLSPAPPAAEPPTVSPAAAPAAPSPAWGFQTAPAPVAEPSPEPIPPPGLPSLAEEDAVQLTGSAPEDESRAGAVLEPTPEAAPATPPGSAPAQPRALSGSDQHATDPREPREDQPRPKPAPRREPTPAAEPTPAIDDGQTPAAPPDPQSGGPPGPADSPPGRGGEAPGQSGESPGQGGSAPGQSGEAPGLGEEQRSSQAAGDETSPDGRANSGSGGGSSGGTASGSGGSSRGGDKKGDKDGGSSGSSGGKQKGDGGDRKDGVKK